ncbi:hypothetical protein IQ22_01974 [Pseudomonas duriflava]|uniref:HdeA/HdeB family protein n=1 Tax=Pseudomonas duriflava TaxID=459528 RepID=A0A562QE84_9PSED|nr:hypothetical protein [Pseudomonas duriflava]TWI55062.1 hypothetical protein IQ22_01974 [Pseudomonas duriflava]
MKGYTGMAAAVLALTGTLAHAQESATTASLGIGPKPCRVLLQEWDTIEPYASAWVSGYFSFFNETTRSGIKNVSEGMDADLRMQWIRDHCQKNPVDTLQDSAEALGKELVDYRAGH